MKRKKTTRCVLSLLLVLMLTFSLVQNTFAAETDGNPESNTSAGSISYTDENADSDQKSGTSTTKLNNAEENSEEGSQSQVPEDPGSSAVNPEADPEGADTEKPEDSSKPAVVCKGDANVADCAAETHIEGCPKFVSNENTEKGEDSGTDPEKAAIQARIDALPGNDDFAGMSEEDKKSVAEEYASIMEKLDKLCESEGKEDIDELEGVNLEKLIGLADAINAYTAAAEEKYVAWIGDQGYTTLLDAVKAAPKDEITTIKLGEDVYTLYGKISGNGSTNTDTTGKRLVFVGAGKDKTTWNIGTPEEVQPGQGNGDFSFGGSASITFKNMTLKAAITPNGKQDNRNYTGFPHTKDTIVEDCIIDGRTCYWGYTSAMFKDTTFNCPRGDYALWTYSSPKMTFEHCTFNSKGKVINVYRDDVSQHCTINFNNCTVNNNFVALKQVLNINDSNTTGLSYTINITGNNAVTGLKPDKITCSRLFGFGGKSQNNAGHTVVNFGGTTVWKDGKMIDPKTHHNSGVMTDGVSYKNDVEGANDSLYVEGYKDDAFTITTMPNGATTKTCNYCGYTERTDPSYVVPTYKWDVSRSKTAASLDENKESTITLSLPSAEEKLNSDVVFVLDGSSSATTAVVEDSLKLLEELKTATENSGAAVNVCVVKFKRRAYKSDWYDLSNNYDDIKKAMGTKYSGGTNIHAGLLAGKEALDQHGGVSADRKYLILISDGSTYLYSKDGNWASETPFTRSYYPKEPYNRTAGSFWDVNWYEPNFHPDVNVVRPNDTSDVAAWHNYLNDVRDRNETVNSQGHTGDYYDYHCDYDLNFNQGKPSPDFKTQPGEPRTASNRDMAFYYANEAWNNIKDSGYHAYSIAVKDGLAGAGNADDSRCFMNYLNDGASLNFDDIKKEIIYAVGAGSQVEDKMGSEFDLVPDTFQLTVGGTQLTCTRSGNTYSFGDSTKDRFVIVYDESNDSFIWTINENVSNFAPVQLSYKVKLAAPATAAGTYTVPTNEYAKLTTVDSAGTTGSTFDFEVPTVSYTITNDTLSYDANGGTGSMNPVTGNEGSTVTIAESGFTRSGYTFTGWNTQADGKGTSYKAGDSFTLAGKDTVLYAQWSKNAPVQVKLSYDANGGTGSMNPVTGNEGSTVTIAESGFTRSGYTFTGWNTQADGKGTSYKAGDSFTLAGKDTVLYAQWSKKGSGKHSKSSKSSNSSEIGGNSSETVKTINSPHTGDNNHLLTWVLLLIISGCAVIGMVLYSRKKNRKAE